MLKLMIVGSDIVPAEGNALAACDEHAAVLEASPFAGLIREVLYCPATVGDDESVAVAASTMATLDSIDTIKRTQNRWRAYTHVWYKIHMMIHH